MKVAKIFLLPLFLCAVFIAKAQEGELKLTINYSLGVPLSDLKDLTSDVSPRGANLSFLYGISDKFSVGLGGSYQDFYEKYPRQVYNTGDGTDISAVLTNSVQLIPIMAMARYNFTPGKTIQPYIGVGVGGNMVMFKQSLGEYTWDEHNKFGFVARPQLGIVIPVSKNKETGINLSAAYNYMPFHYGSIDNFSNLTFHLGVSLPVRE